MLCSCEPCYSSAALSISKCWAACTSIEMGQVPALPAGSPRHITAEGKVAVPTLGWWLTQRTPQWRHA